MRNGKIIIGGTKYNNEFRKSIYKYLDIITELDRANKLIKLNDTEVDHHQKYVENLEKSNKFDDPHLVAMVRVSGCKIICTNEKRAIPFLKKNVLFQPCAKRPKIYSKRGHEKILKDQRNFASICKKT